MTKRVISANLKFETVQKILAMQEAEGIKHFSDAVQVYIDDLERRALRKHGVWGSGAVRRVLGIVD